MESGPDQVRKRAGKTIILVTHNPAYEAFSTHRITIHDGTVSFKG